MCETCRFRWLLFLIAMVPVAGLCQRDYKIPANAKLSEVILKYDNGQIRERYSAKYWRSGNESYEAKHGDYISYRENGDLDVKCTYVDGNLDGLWTHIESAYGNKEETRYDHGKRTWLATYYKNGQKAVEVYCNNPNSSEPNGPRYTYYENGNIQSKSYYINGWKEGLAEGFFIDGSLASKKTFKKVESPYGSQEDGVSTEWYESGHKKQIWIHCAGAQFPNGAWSTRWKTWDENGKLTYQLPTEVIKDIPCWDEVKGELEETEYFEIKILVEATGHEVYKGSVFCKTHEPSRITLEGTIRDQDKNPVVGAVVTLVGLNKKTKTNDLGQYRVEAIGQGSKPFSATQVISLNRLSKAGKVEIVCGVVIPVPGVFPLEIEAVGKDGLPIRGARVIVTVESPQPISFLFPTDRFNPLTDSNGRVTIGMTCRKPGIQDYTTLANLPLVAKFVCRVEDMRSRKLLAKSSITRPFNMARIHGTTVGPDMKGRSEGNAPSLGTLVPYESGGFSGPLAKSLLIDRDNNSRGEFWLLVHPLNPKNLNPFKKDWWKLDWTGMARLPLAYHLKEAPKAGEQLELGKIDLLSPDEHEKRLRKIVRQFIQDMPLTPEAKAEILKALPHVKWVYEAKGEVPVFQDNMLGYGGNIATPEKPDQYWGRNPVRTDDAAYVIMLHELGHFMHHALVERHFYMNCMYNKIATGDHKTWVSIQKDLVRGMHLSFTESQADFFAVLAQSFWGSWQPEINDSVYFKDKQYLPDFKNDDRAMKALDEGGRGYMVEGIQTRFLMAYYQNHVQKQPVWVYSDYLKTMLEYTKASGEIALMQRPARTIRSWIYTKFKVHGEDSIYGLAARYRLLFGNPEVTIMPIDPTGRNLVRINDKLYGFKRFPVARVPMGFEIEVLEGTMNLDLSGKKQRRTLFLREGTKITLKSREEVVVQSGLVGADYPVVLLTPAGSIKPKGTVVTVEVRTDGKTEIKTLEGVAEILLSDGKEYSLSAGRAVSVSPGGTCSEGTRFDPVTSVQQFGNPPAIPFKLEMMHELGNELGPGDVFDSIMDRLSGIRPLWYVIAALIGIPAVLLLLFLFGSGLWYFRRFFVAIPLGLILFFAALFVLYLFFDFHGGPGTDPDVDILSLAAQPYTVWFKYQDWVPMTAWILSSLFIGAGVRGGVRGILASLISVVFIWMIIFPETLFFDWTQGTAWRDVWDHFLKSRIPDVATISISAVLGGGLGGLVFRNKPSHPSKQSRRRSPRDRRHDFDDYEDYHDSHDYDDDSGDMDD